MTTSSPAHVPTPVPRLVDDLPPVHLEPEVPEADPAWTLGVDGLVGQPLLLSFEGLRGMGEEVREIDFHCVWGWSRRACRWTGVGVDRVLDLAAPAGRATVLTVRCRVEPYAACVRLEDARDGMLAWALDGAPLASENGAPLRFVPPARLWGYKGVKWVGRLSVQERFVPGFWESKVGDPEGRVPAEVLATFETPQFRMGLGPTGSGNCSASLPESPEEAV